MFIECVKQWAWCPHQPLGSTGFRMINTAPHSNGAVLAVREHTVVRSQAPAAQCPPSPKRPPLGAWVQGAGTFPAAPPHLRALAPGQGQEWRAGGGGSGGRSGPRRGGYHNSSRPLVVLLTLERPSRNPESVITCSICTSSSSSWGSCRYGLFPAGWNL